MRWLLSIVIVSAGCFISAYSDTKNIKDAKPASGPPNIILIVGDDQGYADLNYKGLVNDVSTPNLDKLAMNGITFTNAYVTAPICNASRAGLISGSYHQRFTGYWYGGKGLENEQFPTIAEMLKTKGYRTGYVGKFHYGKNSTPDSRNFPLNHGFDSFYGSSGGRKHYLIHNEQAQNDFMALKKAFKTKGPSLEMGGMWVNDKKVDQEGFSTELFGQKARDFIQENQQSTFFLQLSFNAVHNFTHQLPESHLKHHKLKGYRDWDPATENYKDWYRGGRFPNNPEGREHYLGQLHFMDKEIGQVLDALVKHQLSDNTIVIYISDNGGSTPIYANNGELKGSKYTLYEGGIRIPFIVYGGERYLNSKTFDQVVSTMDLFPTILMAAGIKIPGHIDGIDLTPWLTSDKNVRKERVLIWDTGYEVAVRKGKWKYHIAYNDQHARIQMVQLQVGESLFNLDKDPGEKVNLITDHPEIANELKSIHQSWLANADSKPKRRVKK